MKEMKARWTGIRPLLMHNGQLADPTNQFTRAIKEITSKGSKKITDVDYENRDRFEYEGSLYWDKELGPIIPSDNIERCLQLGAQKARLGKEVESAVFGTEPFVKLEYDGPRKLESLICNPKFTLRKGVVPTKGRIIRVRPMFPTGWSIEFTLEYDDTIVNERALQKAMVDAGALIGLGDHRPKFGRFLVDVL